MSAADATIETPPGDRSDSKEKTRKSKGVKKVVEVKSDEDSSSEVENDQSMNRDNKGNLVLEDGTMVVEPEDADDDTSRSSNKVKSEPRTKKHLIDPDQILTCTACSKQINQHVAGNLRRHPVLRVLICKKCYQWYMSDEIDQDSNGIDEQCRWCGEGGNLLCCDFCHNAFCKKCIKRNLGRSHLQDIQEAGDDDKWKCYVCVPKPLKKLQEDCDELIKAVEEEEKKQKVAEEKKKQEKELRKSKKSDNTKNGGKGKRSRRSPSTSSERTPKRSNMKTSKDVVKMSQKLMTEDDDFTITPDILTEVLEKMVSTVGSVQEELQSLKKQLSDAVEATDTDKLSEVKKRLCGELKSLMLKHTKETRQLVLFVKTLNQMNSSLSPKKGDLLEGEQFGRVVTMPNNQQMIVLKDGRSFPFDGNVPKGYRMVIQQRAQPAVQLKQGEVIELTDSEDETDDKGSKPKTPKKAFQFRINLTGGKKVLSLPTQKKSPKVGSSKSKPKKESAENHSDNQGDGKKDEGEPMPGSSSSKEDVKKKVGGSAGDDEKENKGSAPRTNGNVEPGRAVAELAEAVTNGLLDDIEPMDASNCSDDEKLVQLDGTDVDQDSVYIQLQPVDEDEDDDDAMDDDVPNGDIDDQDTLDSEDDEVKKTKNVVRERPTRKAVENVSKRKRCTETSDNSDSDSKTQKAKKPRAQISSRSREDIEAQRKLHQELIEDTSSDDEDSDSDFDDSDSDDSDIPSSGDEYDPRGDFKTLQKDRKEKIERSGKKKKKEKEEKIRVRSYMKKTSVKRRKKKNKDKNKDKKKDKDGKKGKNSKKSKKDDDDSDDESEDDSKKKKKSKRSKDSDEESEEEDKKTKKGRKKKKNEDSDDEETEKRKKKSKQSKGSDEESDDEDNKMKKGSKKKNEDSDDEDSEKKKKKSKQSKGSDDESDDEGNKSKKRSKKKKEDSDDEDSEDEDSEKTKKKSKQSKGSDDESDNEGKLKKGSKKKKIEDSVDEDSKTKKKSKPSKGSGEECEDEDNKTKKGLKKIKNEDSNDDDDDSVKKKKSKQAKDSDDGSDDENKKLKKGSKKTSDSDNEDSKPKKKDSKHAKDSDVESEGEDEKTKKGSDSKAKTSKNSTEPQEKDVKKSKKSVISSKRSDDESDEEVEKEIKKESKKSKKTESSGVESEDENSSKSKKTSKKTSKKIERSDSEKEGKDSSEMKPLPEVKGDKEDCSDEDFEESKRSRRPAAKGEKKERKSDNVSEKKEKKASKSREDKVKKEDKAPSDESDYDPELEKEIEKLGKMPVLKLKKLKIERKENGDMHVKEADADSNKDDNEKSEKKSKDAEKGEKKSKEDKSKAIELGRRRRKEKKDVLDDLESDEEEGEESEEEPQEDMRRIPAMDSDEEFEQKKKIAEEKKKVDKEEQARKALLATSSEDDVDDDEDDDDEGSSKETKESKKSKEPKKKKVDSDSDDDEEIATIKSKRVRNKLLDAKISSDDDSDVAVKKKKKVAADSDDDFVESMAKDDDDDDDDDGDIAEAESDSDIDTKKKKKKGKKSSGEEGSDSDAKGKKKRRRRIKVAKSSGSDSDSDVATPRRKKKKKTGSDDEDEDGEPGSGKKAKNIRKIMKDKKLTDETKAAAKAEEERRERMKERQKKYNQVIIEAAGGKASCPVTTKLVLESDEDGKPIMEVHPQLICKLKPHQVEAVKFLWDCTVESLDRLHKEDGGGCILAHCMGLGKTLSVIAFVHTLMSKRKKTKVTKTLVVCPLNTVLNWQREWQKWFEDIDDDRLWTPLVYELASVKNNWGRADNLSAWYEDGGIMILSYEMYRNLTQHKFTKNKKQKKIFTETLVDPGPDFVICDEGHVLKNSGSALAKAMNTVRTRRRIVLTGTPLQNNLIEYHCMVDFVKPNLLGTKQEFANRFVNPMTNGQCSDSTPQDVKLMKKRAHILHETLAGCVQRQDYTALTKFLPPKHEYVILVRLCPLQVKLYEGYLNKSGQVDGQVVTRGGRIFQDFNNLMRIWTHPWILKLDEIRQENKRMYDSESSFLDDEEEESEMSLSSSEDDKKKRKKKASSEEPQPGTSSGKGDGDEEAEIVKEWKTRSRRRQALENGEEEEAELVKPEEENSKVSSEWWAEFLTPEDQYKVELSGKITLLAEILKMSEAIGDKILVFSQSLLSLDMIEDFLEHWDKNKEESQVSGIQGWTHGLDYFRMDGSTQAHIRKRWQEEFNDLENARARLFLISTRAGGIGINLVGANRVIIFDSSWNPSHDVQSIFRVYRFGQDKPVYIYRFLSQGTMEEKIYNRQVTKQSLAARVMDEQQIERHFTYSDLKELYTFTPDRLDDGNEKPTPKLPKDRMLAELLTDKKDWIVNYHEHDSLLENKVGEDLTEEDRKAAWEEYEQEKKGIKRSYTFSGLGSNYNAAMALQMQQQQQIMMQQRAAAMGYPNVSESQLTHYAKLLYDSNPNMSAEELQQRLQQLVHLQMQQHIQQQQQMMLQRQLEKARQDNQRQQEQHRQLLAHYQQQQRDVSGTMARPQSFPNLNSALGIGRTEGEEGEEESTLKDLLKFGQK